MGKPAKPIKDTPILTGRDAITFLREISSPKQVSQAERSKVAEDYRRFRAAFATHIK